MLSNQPNFGPRIAPLRLVLVRVVAAVVCKRIVPALKFCLCLGQVF